MEIRKELSYILRFGAKGYYMDMDPAGWVPLNEIMGYLNCVLGDIYRARDTDDKKIFEITDGKIRCCQGHSKDLRLSSDALEASWSKYQEDECLYHKTDYSGIKRIIRDGALPMDRTHVHLFNEQHPCLGRTSAPLRIEVNPSKVRKSQPLFIASNGVILTRYVPIEALDCVVSRSRGGARRAFEISKELNRIKKAKRRS